MGLCPEPCCLPGRPRRLGAGQVVDHARGQIGRRLGADSGRRRCGESAQAEAIADDRQAVGHGGEQLHAHAAAREQRREHCAHGAEQRRQVVDRADDANAGPVVNVLFGKQWLFIITPLRLMCIAGGSISVVALTGSVVLATGRAAVDLKLSGFAMVFLTLTMVASVGYGLVGVSAGFLAYTVVSNSVSQYFTNKIAAIPTKRFLGALLPGTITALGVGVVVHVIGNAAYRLYGSHASVGAAAAAAALT